ncbi:MAG: prenyltransferase [Candidatus Methanoplasma sp.]|jgi:1,4-dihydroxy-2-naphthoate octaprenyltransferase|nr:prenyltransferase [Candidatus Methanoplasma sp.]
MESTERISILRRLNLIFRFSYTLAFLFASLCGIAFAYVHYTDIIPLYIAILVPATVLFMAIFVNFSNDYYDSVSGVDDLRFNRAAEGMNLNDSPLLKKIYWDGNPVNNGMVTRKQARAIMIVLAAICIILGIPTVLYGGWIAAALGISGLLIAFFYTAPPVNLGARGLGEVAVGISFFLMVFASYFIATKGVWNTEILVFAVLIAILVGSMRLVDSMSGQDAHIAAGERSISVIMGLDGMIPLIKAVIVAGYVVAGAMLYFDLTYLLLFLTLPLAAAGWKNLNRKEQYWEIRMAPVMFLTAFLTEILFIIIQVLQIFFEYSLF